MADNKDTSDATDAYWDEGDDFYRFDLFSAQVCETLAFKLWMQKTSVVPPEDQALAVWNSLGKDAHIEFASQVLDLIAPSDLDWKQTEEYWEAERPEGSYSIAKWGDRQFVLTCDFKGTFVTVNAPLVFGTLEEAKGEAQIDFEYRHWKATEIGNRIDDFLTLEPNDQEITFGRPR